MTQPTQFTPAKRDELRKLYDVAVKEGREYFMFEDQEVLVDYAKYLLQFLDDKFGDRK